ncbi:hypothetical protein Back2_06720 [Nocardioides baekrokdamisoli]|uniref:Uncharacterized protein n=1 Tax=Nocardioides baekrokdamisoli TaxID=1804624 RepID=A0A3G9IJZ5_9ACTN|nr:hypothetical protein [Nocardioides baekrokdamisoli]BBH16385.1 hypothetical protein Back2_06720 [Nocardioides baekrokdamisoli]
MSGFSMRSAVAGGVFATALVLGTSALAGTGVGGIFNLGRANSVNASTSLIGSTSSSQLAVRNNGSGPALTLIVPSGHAPMAISAGAGKVANLNADKLNGISSSGFQRSCQSGGVLAEAAVSGFSASTTDFDTAGVFGGWVCNSATYGSTVLVKKTGPGAYEVVFGNKPNANKMGLTLGFPIVSSTLSSITVSIGGAFNCQDASPTTPEIDCIIVHTSSTTTGNAADGSFNIALM